MAPGKSDNLNDLLLKDPKITGIIKGDIKLKTGKFNLKVGNAIADDTNIKGKAVVTVSGKIEVNGQESDNDFTFTIEIKSLPVKTDKQKANAAVTALNGLTGITFKETDLLATGRSDKLNELLFKDPTIIRIIKGDIKLKTGKFTLKVAKVNYLF